MSVFSMCHHLDLEERLPADTATLAPADLLLTKLQIFEVNDKDLVDAIALLLSHPVVSGAASNIDRDRLSTIVGGDWGWYTTMSDNLAKSRRPTDLELTSDQRTVVAERLQQIRAALDDAPIPSNGASAPKSAAGCPGTTSPRT